MEVLGTLGINWKLFLAQLVNFAIVLFIFWKWIVSPLGKILSDRQARIEQGLKNAEYTETEKKKFEEWKQTEMKRTRTEIDNLTRTASDTANKTRQQIIAEAQNDANRIIVQAKAAIESEKAQVMKEAKLELATLVITASEKILRVKLDPKKDQELINESMKQVR